MDGNRRQQEGITEHVLDYYKNPFTKEEWNRPTLDTLEFASIGEENADWLEREFSEEEVKAAVFVLGGDKALGLEGFPMAFFQ